MAVLGGDGRAVPVDDELLADAQGDAGLRAAVRRAGRRQRRAVFGADGPIELARSTPVALADAMERLLEDPSCASAARARASRSSPSTPGTTRPSGRGAAAQRAAAARRSPLARRLSSRRSLYRARRARAPTPPATNVRPTRPSRPAPRTARATAQRDRAEPLRFVGDQLDVADLALAAIGASSTVTWCKPASAGGRCRVRVRLRADLHRCRPQPLVGGVPAVHRSDRAPVDRHANARVGSCPGSTPGRCPCAAHARPRQRRQGSAASTASGVYGSGSSIHPDERTVACRHVVADRPADSAPAGGCCRPARAHHRPQLRTGDRGVGGVQLLQRQVGEHMRGGRAPPHFVEVVRVDEAEVGRRAGSPQGSDARGCRRRTRRTATLSGRGRRIGA